MRTSGLKRAWQRSVDIAALPLLVVLLILCAAFERYDEWWSLMQARWKARQARKKDYGA